MKSSLEMKGTVTGLLESGALEVEVKFEDMKLHNTKIESYIEDYIKLKLKINLGST